jgi:hypothetical protein
MKNAENLSASAIWHARGPVEFHLLWPADVRRL